MKRPKLTMKLLASKVAKLEGKKHQATIGDVREILGIVSDVVYREGCHSDRAANALTLFYLNGKKRAARRKR